MATGFGEEEMVNGFVDSFSVCHEPEIDYSQRASDGTLDAGLFGYLSKRSVFWRLARLDVTLWERPERPSSLIRASDQKARVPV